MCSTGPFLPGLPTNGAANSGASSGANIGARGPPYKMQSSIADSVIIVALSILALLLMMGSAYMSYRKFHRSWVRYRGRRAIMLRSIHLRKHRRR